MTRCKRSCRPSCPFVWAIKEFKHNNVIYLVQDLYSCDSVWVIYIIHCRVCRKIYVGETTGTFRARIGSHQTKLKYVTQGSKKYDDVKNLPIYAHECFQKDKYNMMAFVIDSITPGPDDSVLKAKESGYIAEMGSRYPDGLNVEA